MKIGIDTRSLLGKELSGVGEYVYQIIKSLLTIDQKNQYLLFANKKNLNIPPFKFRGSNLKWHLGKIPNKLFNLKLIVFKRPYLDKLLGGVDIFFIPNFNFLALSSLVKKVLVVYDLSFFHFPEFFTLKQRIWHKAVRPFHWIRKVDKIIAISNSTAQDLIDNNLVPQEKIEIIPLGVDFEFYQKEFHSSLSLPSQYILFLGTLEPRKNLITLIQAYYKLNQKKPLPPLILAGPSGWRSKFLKKFIKKLDLVEKIKYIGYLTKEDKAYILQKAYFLVYPSFYEGFGLPPLEAMACGTPVIASNVSSLGEVIEKAGLLVNPHDVNELIIAMERLLEEQNLREELSQAGIKRAQKFSWEKTAKLTLDLFYNLI